MFFVLFVFLLVCCFTYFFLFVRFRIVGGAWRGGKPGGESGRLDERNETVNRSSKLDTKKVHCEIISISKQQQAEATTIGTTEEFDRW